MVTNVTSLLKTVKAVEDEHTRGTRALESSIEAIAQEIRAFDSSETPRSKAEPEDLIRATRPITLATGKAVSAGKSLKQEDIIVAANMGRKAISDMLTTCKVKTNFVGILVNKIVLWLFLDFHDIKNCF
jgi:talin